MNTDTIPPTVGFTSRVGSGAGKLCTRYARTNQLCFEETVGTVRTKNQHRYSANTRSQFEPKSIVFAVDA